MKKIVTIILVLGVIFLSSCSGNSAVESSQSSQTSVASEEASLESVASENSSTESSSSEGESSGAQISNEVTYIADESVITEWVTNGKFVPEPATTTTIETYKFLEGTDMENEIVVLTAEQEGPTVFIVASIHGDEKAGYTAADMLKGMQLKTGRLFILSPANVLGAQRNTRYADGTDDPNRAFPGKEDGTKTQRLAYGIFSEIEKAMPDMVLDLHEARAMADNRDFLGSSLIYTSLDGMEDLFLDMYLATQTGDLCSEPFNFFAPGPNNSFNSAVSKELSIPIITFETFRGYQLERRVEDQLALVGYVLGYLGLV